MTKKSLAAKKDVNHTCNLCGSKEYVLFHDTERNGEDLSNFICQNCGFVFVLPRPDIASLKDTYLGGKFSVEVRGSELPSDKKILQLEKKAYKRMLLLEKTLPELFKTPNAENNILEIGCGIGSFIRLFENMGWSVKGIEPDVGYSEFGSKWYNINIESVFLEDFTPPVKYDIVSTFHVIEHTDDPRQFAQRCFDLLKENGTLFLECPSLDYQYGDDPNVFFWKEHINTFSNKTLVGLLKSVGFDILQEWNFDSAINIIAKKSLSPQPQVTYDSANRLIAQKRQFKPNKISSKINWTINEGKIWYFESSYNGKNVFKYLLRKHIFNKNPFSLNKLVSKYQIVHVGHTNYGNVGDTVLFDCVRSLVQSQVDGSIHYIKVNTHNTVTEKTIELINSSSALIIGGGGLFLKDSNPNQKSGWQWPVPTELLKKINVPIYIVAVGYNQFRGQEGFGKVFTENLQVLFEKAKLIGIRNYGSIRELAKFVPNKKDKILFQPCPTTFAMSFLPHIKNFKATGKYKKIAINLAFDRHMMRFGENENAIVREILEAGLAMRKMGYEVLFFGHAKHDKDLRYYLKNDRYNFEYTDLSYATTNQLYDFYKDLTLVFGMRGHAQMIPFGMGIPIFSLISHNKLFYFLEDTNLTECGAEVKDPELKRKMVDFVKDFDFNTYHQKILIESKKLFDLSVDNLNVIGKTL